ncbi:Proteophosphoglycan ppg4 [Rhodotorula toruloides ATCC 204091]|uniref:Copper transport protein n=1 Tax=Rhodotorula toruloides TaxID=5286 RepID=A0A2T0ACX0_RHOTO|nr:Proteophosphoglycan ppg4 [Rhodotorula toruloides ATCC 204091]PRQ75855.1 Proteophosphoglycan ppg4 [Rhodotorula toruloides]
MDHGGHAGHGDMPSDSPHAMACKMSMLWNTDPVGHCLVFPSLQITQSSVVPYLAAIVLLSMLCEYLRLSLSSFDRALRSNLRGGAYPPPSRIDGASTPRLGTPAGGLRRTSALGLPTDLSEEALLGGGAHGSRARYWGVVRLPWTVQLRRSLHYVAHISLSFYIMLLVMSYNAQIIFSIILGAFLGHFIFQRSIDLGASGEDEPKATALGATLRYSTASLYLYCTTAPVPTLSGAPASLVVRLLSPTHPLLTRPISPQPATVLRLDPGGLGDSSCARDRSSDRHHEGLLFPFLEHIVDSPGNQSTPTELVDHFPRFLPLAHLDGVLLFDLRLRLTTFHLTLLVIVTVDGHNPSDSVDLVNPCLSSLRRNDLNVYRTFALYIFTFVLLHPHLLALTHTEPSDADDKQPSRRSDRSRRRRSPRSLARRPSYRTLDPGLASLRRSPRASSLL